MKPKSVLIVLPDSNFNDVEFFTLSEHLRKYPIACFFAAETGNLCISECRSKVKPDVSFYNMNSNNFDGLIFIGGKGTAGLVNNSKLHALIHQFNKQNKLIAAICSSVLILAESGILVNIKATCFPLLKDLLIKNKAIYTNNPVVISGNIITAEGPEASALFSKSIINYLDNLK